MTIPLDNLYHYIEGLFDEPVCVYLFYPHGNRNILNLTGIRPFNRTDFEVDVAVFPQIICNDQEPLNYEFYQNITLEESNYFSNYYKEPVDQHSNLRVSIPKNIHDGVILIHSEKNSKDLQKYKEDEYIDVYYWCHAIIAKDWYRFAEHDVRLQSIKNTTNKDFLIYCRDWTGSREYRIKFQELLVQNNLLKNSTTAIMKTNDFEQTIKNFVFKNKNFIPTHTKFVQYLPDNTADAASSASYCPDDFNNSHISVVLETVFDDEKIHLTEKILRPIACGHPFLLAAGPRSLEYLRSYGFKTFSPWLNEDYDLEHNSLIRLEKIIQSMKNFAELPFKEKKQVCDNINAIAKYNQERFFSKEFTELIVSELKKNISNAVVAVKKTRSLRYRSRKVNHQNKHLRKDTRKIIAKYLNSLRKLNPPEQ